MLLDRLALPRLRGAEAVLVAIVVDALGSGLFAPFSLLYFHNVARLDLPTVGVAIAVFQISFNIANLIGPAFFTLLFARHPAAPWVALAAIAAVAALATLGLERRLPAVAIRSNS